ncbi:unnamed protein product [Meganyctiphanes norvegica]|uniref:RING-type domain-containing protein n=1 Tax=Meganyctiphanes norvegica TaxID=48144 RepID=A0AAV2QDB5_MEGNR
MDFLECKVCHVQYDEEEHRPRHALCGHEYCSTCIKALIKDSIFECPKCRQKNKVDAPEDMTVSFGLIDVIRAFKTKSIPLDKEMEPKSSGATNDEVCNMHGKSLGHWCLKCQLWLCSECLENHTSLVGCSTKTVDDMKKKNNKDTDVLLSSFEVNTEFVSSKIQELNDKRKEISDKRKKLLEISEKYGEEVNMLTSILEQGNLQKEEIIEAKRYLNATDSSTRVIERLKDLTHRKQVLRNWSVKNLGTMDTPLGLLKVFEEEKDVYTEMIVNDEKRHAKLSKLDRNIDIHPFLKQAVPDGTVCMPFARLQKMIPETPLVFLELEIGGTVKGRVHVRLENNLPNTRDYVVQIVTGQRGPTLIGISLPHRDASQGLYQGNYMPFTEMKFTPDSNRRSTSKRGDVTGDFGNSYLQFMFFHIAMPPHTHIHGNSRYVFGHIEEGMDVIQECYDSYSKDVKITDCGLVIEQE